MKKRILYLISLFFVIVLIFVIAKPIFMLYNSVFAEGLTFKDYLEVMWNGLTLDNTSSAILILVPYLVLFISIWIKLNPRKVLGAYFFIVALVIAIILVVDTSLYEFWSFKLDATILFYIDSPSNVAASVSTMFIVIRIALILIIFDAIFVLMLRMTPSELPAIKTIKAKLLSSLVMLLLGGVIFGVLRGGFTVSVPNVGRVYYSSNQFLNHSAVNPLFSFFSSLSKTEKFTDQFNFFPEEERAELFNGLYPNESGSTRKLLNNTRPNVLVILLESFSTSYIEVLGGIPDVTPYFNKLADEGILFTNYYSSSFRTDRGVLSALSGHPGLPTASIMKIPVKSKTLPSIAKSLLKEGYNTDFLYGGDVNFTNMQSYLRETGYQKIVADKSFTLKEQGTQKWGVNDDITFEYLYNDILTKKESPWFSTFLTLSNHEPFVVPFSKFDDEMLNAAAFTDECLGVFIEKLKNTPEWENLLIICLPDHGGRYPRNLNINDPKFFYSPMLWLGGAVNEPEKVNLLMNQSDMAATLLGQLDVDHDDFLFSRDIFSDTYTYPFTFFSFNNGFGFADSTGVSVYDNNANVPISEVPAHSKPRLDRAKAILQTLYDDLDAR